MDNYTIFYNDLELELIVEGFWYQEPDRGADNPNDFYGYTEVDFLIASIWQEDENGERQALMFPETVLDNDELEEIEQELIEKILQNNAELELDRLLD